jgi:hypothetical protein
MEKEGMRDRLTRCRLQTEAFIRATGIMLLSLSD